MFKQLTDPLPPKLVGYYTFKVCSGVPFTDPLTKKPAGYFTGLQQERKWQNMSTVPITYYTVEQLAKVVGEYTYVVVTLQERDSSILYEYHVSSDKPAL